MSEPTTVTHASGPRAGQPVTPTPAEGELWQHHLSHGGRPAADCQWCPEPDPVELLEDALCRRVWVAALRDGANRLLQPRGWSSAADALRDRACVIESGVLTPWADQPEPARFDELVDNPDQAGALERFGIEPTVVDALDADQPAEPAPPPAVVRCHCGERILHAAPDGYGRDGCDDPAPADHKQLHEAVAEAERRAEAAEDRAVTAGAERQWAADGVCRRCGHGLPAAESDPIPRYAQLDVWPAPDPGSGQADDCLRTGAEVRARGESGCCGNCGYPAAAHPGDTPGAADCDQPPEPDSGPRWDADTILDAAKLMEPAGDFGALAAKQLRALLADRDERERERDHSDAALQAAAADMARMTVERDRLWNTRDARAYRWQDAAERYAAEVGQLRDALARYRLNPSQGELDAARAELAEVTADRDRLRAEVERYRPLWSDPLARPDRWATEPNPHPRLYISTHEVLEDYDGAIRCSSEWPPEKRHATLDRTLHHVRPLVYEIEHLRAELATARRDAAADTLADGAGRVRRIFTETTGPRVAQYLDAMARGYRAGTRPTLGSPQPPEPVDPVGQAHDTIAHHAAAVAVAGDPAPEWGDYPDLGEHDWRQVVERRMRLAAGLGPEQSVYDAAYQLLASRAGDDEGGPAEAEYAERCPCGCNPNGEPTAHVTLPYPCVCGVVHGTYADAHRAHQGQPAASGGGGDDA